MIVDPNTHLHDSVTAGRSGRDEEEAKFKIGQQVKLLSDIVNDGTYPHSPIGTLMMPKSSIGYIKDMGDFLQVIRVYEVHFIDAGMELEVVGCREHELEATGSDEDMDSTEGELFKKKIQERRKNESN